MQARNWPSPTPVQQTPSLPMFAASSASLEAGPERFPQIQPPAELDAQSRTISSVHTSTPVSELVVRDISSSPLSSPKAPTRPATVHSRTFDPTAAQLFLLPSSTADDTSDSPVRPPKAHIERSPSMIWMMETIEAFEPVMSRSTSRPKPTFQARFPQERSKSPERSATVSTYSSSIYSTAESTHTSTETPVVRTAIAYNRAHSGELPRASMLRLHSEDSSRCLALAQVPTAYVPYRPPFSSG